MHMTPNACTSMDLGAIITNFIFSLTDVEHWEKIACMKIREKILRWIFFISFCCKTKISW
jgi:hypothetical protein